jgi:hypothetical protein
MKCGTHADDHKTVGICKFHFDLLSLRPTFLQSLQTFGVCLASIHTKKMFWTKYAYCYLKANLFVTYTITAQKLLISRISLTRNTGNTYKVRGLLKLFAISLSFRLTTQGLLFLPHSHKTYFVTSRNEPLLPIPRVQLNLREILWKHSKII